MYLPTLMGFAWNHLYKSLRTYRQFLECMGMGSRNFICGKVQEKATTYSIYLLEAGIARHCIGLGSKSEFNSNSMHMPETKSGAAGI